MLVDPQPEEVGSFGHGFTAQNLVDSMDASLDGYMQGWMEGLLYILEESTM